VDNLRYTSESCVFSEKAGDTLQSLPVFFQFYVSAALHDSSEWIGAAEMIVADIANCAEAMLNISEFIAQFYVYDAMQCRKAMGITFSRLSLYQIPSDSDFLNTSMDAFTS